MRPFRAPLFGFLIAASAAHAQLFPLNNLTQPGGDAGQPGTPCGTNGQLQYNNAGACGGATTGSGVLAAIALTLNGSGALLGSNSPAISGTATVAVGSAIEFSGNAEFYFLNGGAFAIFRGLSGIDGGFSVSASGTSQFDFVADGINFLSMRNGTAANKFQVFNTFTDASNGEWGAFDWQTTANTLTIGARANGTGTQRGINFVGASVAINGTAGVSCAAGTVTLLTLVITNGLVTHC